MEAADSRDERPELRIVATAAAHERTETSGQPASQSVSQPAGWLALAEAALSRPNCGPCYAYLVAIRGLAVHEAR